jgi:hypothetical protein
VTPAQLSQLPFNIQETKLIHHGGAYPPAHANHPQNAIAAAIKRGWQELDSQPHYLDLPAYDAVRGPYPADVDGESSVTRMLVLCSFAKDHEANWLHISNALTLRYDKRQAARMLEVASPRLVGQALYEGIRWARTCMVDWTGWRANVFFELGVRMGCADVGPVCVIEQRAAEAVASGEGLTQRRLLMTLIAPTSYRMDLDDEGLPHALAVHDAIVQQRPPALPVSQLPHDATFRTCRDWFDWNQEHITMDPQDFLRGSIEAPFGKDVQAAGHSPVLFSANEGYSKDLDRSVKERWLAAWLYVSGRYPKEQWKEDRALRAKVRKLANDVLQFALQKPGEPLLIELRDQLRDVLKELAALDALEQPTEAPTERIRALKTAAKNQRDRGLEGYPRAESLLREAIAIAEAELGSPGVAERGVIATELSDCFGLIGGVQRRWAEETVDSEQKVHLKHSVIAYDAGFGYESSNSKDGPVGSYNLVNRLLVRLFWDPEALAAKREVVVDPGVPALNLADELEKAGAIIRRQLAGPRRGDHWAMADLALIDVLLERGTAASAYAEFIGASPRDFEYESALATVRPLAKLPLASAGVLLEAERLLEDRLKRLRS